MKIVQKIFFFLSLSVISTLLNMTVLGFQVKASSPPKEVNDAVVRSIYQ